MSKLLIISLLFILSLCRNIYSQDLLSIEDGLSDNNATDIFKDSYGFLWVGTENGLNCYNGYDFTTYLHSSNDSTSISSNSITDIIEVENGDLWISTKNGLNRYVREKDLFIKYFKDSLSSNSIANNGIVGLKLIDNYLIIGHWLGASALDLKTMSFKNYIVNKKNTWKNATHCFTADDKDIWIGTKTLGVYKINRKNSKIEKLIHSNKDENAENRIGSIEVSKDRLFIGVGNGEFYNISKIDGSVKKILTPKKRWIQKIILSDSLIYFATIFDVFTAPINYTDNWENQLKNLNVYSPDYINDIYIDNENILWCGIENHGVRPTFSNVKGVKSIMLNEINYSEGELIYFYEDKLYNIWIASNNQLGVFNGKTISNKITTNDGRQINIPKKNSQLGLTLILQSENFDYWFVYSKMVIRLNYKTGTITEHTFSTTAKTQYSPTIIIPIGNEVFAKANKIYKFDFATGEFTANFNKNKLLLLIESHNTTKTSYNSKTQQYWCHNNENFEWFDFNKNSHIKINYNKLSGIGSFTNINHVINEQNNNLWFATKQGAFYLNMKDTSLSHYNVDSGLTHLSVNGINIDNKNRIWTSSNNGLTLIDTKNDKIHQLYKGNGLGTNFFMINMFFTNCKNKFVLGGKDRILFIDPMEFDFSKKEIAPLIFTKIRSENDKLIIKTQAYLTKEITLPYKYNSVFVEFALLSLLDAQKCKYSYRIKNEFENWVNLNYQRSLNLSNLKPGKHILEIKAVNPNGFSVHKPTSLTITIIPPWYKTLVFKIFLVIFILLLFVSINMIRMQRIKKYSKKLELDVKERTHQIELQKEELTIQAENLSEVNALLVEQKEELQSTSDELSISNKTKDKFFSIIAHDLKNPFMSIISFSKILESQFKKIDNKKKLQFISQIKESSNSAYQLLENLLQWSMTQTKNIKFEPKGLNVSKIVSKTIELLILSAENKKISILNITNKQHTIFADKNMVTTVVRNLISNAIKFTPEKGIIEISSIQKDNKIEIHIKDSGIGIEEKVIESLFAIEKVRSTDGTSGEKGTGLGLSLCSDFIKMNNGLIYVESEKGKGSDFIIELPVSKVAIIEDEKDMLAEKMSEDKSNSELESSQILNPNNNISEKIDEEQFKNQIILIVEDNPDIRSSIRSTLENNYKILEATNGREGWDIAIENIPNFIISDLMMPKIDGFELSSKLKNDERTSHIPIIMLTAKDSSKSQIKGLEIGVDDYLTKPIEPEVLNTRIKNILYNRKKMQNRFALELIVKPEEVTTNTTDELFLKRAITIIESNISNSEFSVDAFIKEIGMSRTLLYRKMTHLTGMAISEFIQSIRFKKAALLLKKSDNNISDVGYKVGFTNPVSFTRAFTRQFGKPPSEWLKDNS